MPSMSEAVPDDEDARSAGTTDSDAASMTADGVDDNASRRDSLQSDECCYLLESPTAEDEIDRPTTPFTAVMGYLGRLKKLFDKSTKVGRLYSHRYTCMCNLMSHYK